MFKNSEVGIDHLIDKYNEVVGDDAGGRRVDSLVLRFDEWQFVGVVTNEVMVSDVVSCGVAVF